MAKKTITIFEDDLTGGQADETIGFSLDGTQYEIDLSAENARQFRDTLDVYVRNGRRAGRRQASGRTASRRTPARTDKEQLDAIRRWARDHGYQVSDRGRISQQIRDAYDAAL